MVARIRSGLIFSGRVRRVRLVLSERLRVAYQFKGSYFANTSTSFQPRLAWEENEFPRSDTETNDSTSNFVRWARDGPVRQWGTFCKSNPCTKIFPNALVMTKQKTLWGNKSAGSTSVWSEIQNFLQWEYPQKRRSPDGTRRVDTHFCLNTRRVIES